MDEQEFISIAKRELATIFAHTLPSDWYTAWQVKVLQNNKAMLSTDMIKGKYIEVTYNGDEQEMYVDVYEHKSNMLVKI